jgi:hypothetical protein
LWSSFKATLNILQINAVPFASPGPYPQVPVALKPIVGR